MWFPSSYSSSRSYTSSDISITGGQIRNAADYRGGFGRDNLKILNKTVDLLNEQLAKSFGKCKTAEDIIDRVVEITSMLKDLK